MRWSQRLATRLVLFVFGPWTTVTGTERLSSLRRPVIFAFNHNNALETVVVAAVLAALRQGRVPAFLVDWMFVHFPVVGWLVRLCDPVPVYTKPARWNLMSGTRRAGRARSPVESCAERLAAGADVGIFPEARRNPDPLVLDRGRPGIGRLVLATGADVVPVALVFPAARKTGRVPVFGRLEVHVGQTLSFGAERLSLLEGRDGPTHLPPATSGAFARLVTDRVMAALAPLARKSYSPLQQEERR